jgi:putative nucleotidyltransferase with HDIG domain
MIDDPSQLITVNIESFRNSTRDINFDVYLKLSDDNVVHVFSRSTGLDYKRLAQYMQKGVAHLHIHPEDKEAYEAFVARPALVIFNDPKTTQEKKIATLLNMTEQNMAELFTQMTVTEETAETSQRVISGYVDLMTKSPSTLAIILKLVSHGEYLYYHSIAVAIFSMFIAKASGHFNTRMLEILGLGGFLHDIGSVHLPKDLVDGPHELKDDQVEEMRNHPRHGLKMIEHTSNIADEVRYIVYQHHEQPNGKGYPNKIHGSVIYYPAKIVALADAFSALLSRRPYRPAFSVPEALRILSEEASRGKYDRDLMAIMNVVFMRAAPTTMKTSSGNADLGELNIERPQRTTVLKKAA